MILGEPAQTPYDLNFQFFRYPVRVSAWFWVVGLLFGSQLITNINGLAPWRAFLLWTAAIFLSILIHELGHCLAFQKHGLKSRMVLYHFGGLAIPTGATGQRMKSNSPWSQIEISAAGPVLQILSALALSVTIRLCGFSPPSLSAFGRVGAALDSLMQGVGMAGGGPLPSIDLFVFAYFYTLVSVGWGVLNLLPIYPLDGGQIARSLGTIFFGSEGIRYSLMLSIATGVFLVITRFQSGDRLMALMFAGLAYSSYEALQSTRGTYRPY